LDFKLPYEILQADKLKFIGGMAAYGKQQNPDDEVQFENLSRITHKFVSKV
jgi:hypothetical protein